MPLDAVIAMLRKVSPPPPRNGSPFAVHSRITFTDSSGDTPWSWISCRVVMCMKSAPELRQIRAMKFSCSRVTSPPVSRMRFISLPSRCG